MISKIEKISLGITVIGIWYILWCIIKLIACIMIAGYISTKCFGLSGMYWWFSSILLYCIIGKIIFWNNNFEGYEEIVNKYYEIVDKSMELTEEDVE